MITLESIEFSFFTYIIPLYIYLRLYMYIILLVIFTMVIISAFGDCIKASLEPPNCYKDIIWNFVLSRNYLSKALRQKMLRNVFEILFVYMSRFEDLKYVDINVIF